jgi:hypothetical protein
MDKRDVEALMDLLTMEAMDDLDCEAFQGGADLQTGSARGLTVVVGRGVDDPYGHRQRLVYDDATGDLLYEDWLPPAVVH